MTKSVTNDASLVPVVIVGAGPVGLALAGELGWQGVGVEVFERSDGTIAQPRMDGVGVRTMEHCRRWGIVEWVESSSYPRDYRQDNVYVSSLAGVEFGREPFPAPGDDPGPHQSPQRRERCPQDMFDPILRRHAESYATVDLRYEHTVTAVDDYGDHVVATMVDGTTGQTGTVRAEYVVACDGASSRVRRALGVPMLGRGALTHTTNVIFTSPDLVEQHDKGYAYRFICIDNGGTYATVVAINGGDRWRLSIIGDETPREYSESDVRSVIERVVGRSFAFGIESIVPWVRSEGVAETYRSRRIFLAGDAAHVMSPTGGFGMNTGIGDAVDLGWKLAAVLRGHGGPVLLDSYELERRPIAVRNSKESSANLARLLEPRTSPPPAEALLPAPQGAAARQAYGEWFKDLVRREWFSVGIHLGYEYTDSPICFNEPGQHMDDDVTRYQQRGVPGARAPHVWLQDGSSTLDLFGRGFVLLRLGSQPPSTQTFERAAAEAGEPLTVHTIESTEAHQLYGACLVLVRPDGHIAWRDNELPEAPAQVLAVVSGRTIVASSGVNKEGEVQNGLASERAHA